MNNEQAIEYGKRWDAAFESRGDSPWSKARQFLSLAIKALKETERNPTISSWYDFDRGYNMAKRKYRSEWVPVSERLPEDRDWYLGQFKEPDTDFIGIPYICDYVGEVTKGTTNEGWILRHCTDVDNPSDYFRNLICVAWQPLPEPLILKHINREEKIQNA